MGACYPTGLMQCRVRGQINDMTDSKFVTFPFLGRDSGLIDRDLSLSAPREPPPPLPHWPPRRPVTLLMINSDNLSSAHFLDR
jgi:hypothetical protein